MHNRVTSSNRWLGDNRLDPRRIGAGITDVDRVSPFWASFIARPPCAMCLNHLPEFRDEYAVPLSSLFIMGVQLYSRNMKRALGQDENFFINGQNGCGGSVHLVRCGGNRVRHA